MKNPERKRIVVNTGGGDAPGLNAVIRSAVLTAVRRGWEVFGIRNSYGGLVDGDGLVPLDAAAVRGITHLGGTILGTTNRGDPFCRPTKQPDGTIKELDRSDELMDCFRKNRLDALIAVGGDGSLSLRTSCKARGCALSACRKLSTTIWNPLSLHSASIPLFRLRRSVLTGSIAPLCLISGSWSWK